MARKLFEPYITIREASRLSGMTVGTIRRFIHAGQIPVYGTRGFFRVQMSDVLPPVDLSVTLHRGGTLKDSAPGSQPDPRQSRTEGSGCDGTASATSSILPEPGAA